MEDTIFDLQSRINQRIEKLSYGSSPDSLYEPLSYIMSLGGKRIRPLLTLLTYSLFKDDPEEIIDQAIAVEVFHNFTLMHDDIMDKAPLRRGNPTVHEKWGENTAILSGDVMLVKAYELLMASNHPDILQVLKLFNTCATEVCEGQQWDMDFEKRETVTEQEYLEMIRLKTAVLLGFSANLGAILAGAGVETGNTLRSFGENIGIGFQLMDDLLDVYGDAQKFGKQKGGDILANKKTFLLIEALEKSNSEQKKVLDHWLNAKEFDPIEKVTEVTKIYDQIGIPELAKDKMNEYFSKGLDALADFEAIESRKEGLRKFVLALINRQQ